MRDGEVLRDPQLLMMPQLLSSMVGGRPTGEVTVASTTQMVDPEARDWATDLLEELSPPTDIARATESELDAIHLGGGGVRNELFCQLLADATGRPVQAAPTEATAIGNLVTQAIAVDTLPNVETARRLIGAECEPTTYEPASTSGWDPAKERMAAFEGR